MTTIPHHPGPRELARLLEVAHSAVDLALDTLRELPSPGEVRWKDAGDPVSEADITVERAVRAQLSHYTPAMEFLGEESAAVSVTDGSDERLEGCWVLDPIDGTVNYVHGLPLHAVSLGLLHRGRPVLGVIALPTLGSRYWAHAGGGAHRDGQLIRASTTSELASAVVALGDYATGERAEVRNRDRLALHAALAGRVRRIRMLGAAALDLAWASDGTSDAAVMLANKPWDVTAGVAIARGAGALVTDAKGRSHGLRSGSLVAGAPAVASAIADVFCEVSAADVPGPS